MMRTPAALPPTPFVPKDYLGRLIGIPLVSLLFAVAYDYDILVQFDQRFLPTILDPFLFTLTLWESTRQIFIWSRQRYPRYDQTARRLVMQTLLSIVSTFVITLLLSNLLELIFDHRFCSRQQVLTGFGLNLVPTFFITSIYESAYFFEQWKKNIQQTEALARENIQSQLDVLKSQIDPHFLFNSLNTLAALIDEDNEPAQKYLEQLSDVYRYVLINKDKTAISLREELSFVESYLYLNKTRFRENLRVEAQIPDSKQDQLVAPLSLQMLVENAIKHNIISKDKPLTIRIFQASEDSITVQNNVQAKAMLEKSTRVGLQNIVNRYRYLTTRPVEIHNAGDVFTVTLPLLSA